jgi:16S rRNA (uracil1498-N3)-methyltransferase
MHRFFVDDIRGDTVHFSKDQAHQLRRVLRCEPGDRVLALDNVGYAYEVELTTLARKWAAGQIRAKRPAGGEPTVHLTLYQALLKRDNFEWVLQKGTELGVSRFVPVFTRHSVITAVKPNKIARWRRVLTEAAEQSERSLIPRLAEPLEWEAALAAMDADLCLMPYADASADVSLAAALAGCAERPGRVALCIGPEGGWSPEEVEAGRAAGLQTVTLGPRILRAETAAVVAATLTMHQLGELE